MSLMYLLVCVAKLCAVLKLDSKAEIPVKTKAGVKRGYTNNKTNFLNRFLVIDCEEIGRGSASTEIEILALRRTIIDQADWGTWDLWKQFATLFCEAKTRSRDCSSLKYWMQRLAACTEEEREVRIKAIKEEGDPAKLLWASASHLLFEDGTGKSRFPLKKSDAKDVWSLVAIAARENLKRTQKKDAAVLQTLIDALKAEFLTHNFCRHGEGYLLVIKALLLCFPPHHATSTRSEDLKAFQEANGGIPWPEATLPSLEGGLGVTPTYNQLVSLPFSYCPEAVMDHHVKGKKGTQAEAKVFLEESIATSPGSMTFGSNPLLVAAYCQSKRDKAKKSKKPKKPREPKKPKKPKKLKKLKLNDSSKKVKRKKRKQEVQEVQEVQEEKSSVVEVGVEVEGENAKKKKRRRKKKQQQQQQEKTKQSLVDSSDEDEVEAGDDETEDGVFPPPLVPNHLEKTKMLTDEYNKLILPLGFSQGRLIQVPRGKKPFAGLVQDQKSNKKKWVFVKGRFKTKPRVQLEMDERRRACPGLHSLGEFRLISISKEYGGGYFLVQAAAGKYKGELVQGLVYHPDRVVINHISPHTPRALQMQILMIMFWRWSQMLSDTHLRSLFVCREWTGKKKKVEKLVVYSCDEMAIVKNQKKVPGSMEEFLDLSWLFTKPPDKASRRELAKTVTSQVGPLLVWWRQAMCRDKPCDNALEDKLIALMIENLGQNPASPQ